ncbi:MAG: type IV secretory system conjugative DNA transfer family protein [Alphaproteobacteria bacterium]|nr:type IV secretory system conjugative DNA transfer family protein [Alphaproteobacteria bacterium]
MTKLPLLPRLDPDQMSGAPLATSRWQSSQSVMRALLWTENDPEADSPILLGQLHDDKGKRHFMGFDDDRHVTLIAGSRAGKGVGMILPNLLTYKGSVVCIDPKGENASITASWRAEKLGQKVYVLDPFRAAKVPQKLRLSLNPLEFLDLDHPELIEDVAAIADAIVVPSGGKDLHWDESARAFIKGLLLFILAQAGDDQPKRSMALLRRYITVGMENPETNKTSFNHLLNEMYKTDCPFSDAIAAAAATLADMGENERGSVLSTARRHTEFLEAFGIQDCLKSGNLDLTSLKQDPKGATIYLVLPEWRIATHSRWLRLMVSTIIHALERTPRGINPKTGRLFPAVLMVLEEMAALGRMQAIEKAAGYIAGFGVKLLSVLQDLNQLKTHYEGTWETFLGNSGVVLAYGNSDITTTKYLSSRLGLSELTRVTTQSNEQSGSNETALTLGHALKAISDPKDFTAGLGQQGRNTSSGSSTSQSEQLHKTDLMTPDEVSRFFSRESGAVLALIAGALPIRLERLAAHTDPFFTERAHKNPFHSK